MMVSNWKKTFGLHGFYKNNSGLKAIIKISGEWVKSYMLHVYYYYSYTALHSQKAGYAVYTNTCHCNYTANTW